EALPTGTGFHRLDRLDTRQAGLLEMNALLEDGQVPPNFERYSNQIKEDLRPRLSEFDHLIVHNVFTKHFNLPLTAALAHLVQDGTIRHCIAWCHDFTWTSPNSRHKVFPGQPWDLLRSYDPHITYVTVSQERQRALAGLYQVPEQEIKVIYNGVDPAQLLGLTSAGQALAERLDLLAADLVLLMPVRVTQAKNIEYALELLAALKAGGIRPKLVLSGPPDPHDAGSMAYYRQLQQKRASLGLEDEMHFVFESGPDPEQPYEIGLEMVGDLYRLSDLMLMPSHREGFGMPVLEAGLVGIPAICTRAVPAAVEIGGQDVTLFDTSQPAQQLAGQILAWMQSNPEQRLRRRVRQRYTWQALFKQQIEPLLRDTENR
ncbi:MAG: glycosyltransferase family 4 protein, partial [Anaerolineales bacterium]|nr:glycosyltransferase family 4 protein [Anaerolineales bacterium]